MKCPLSYPAAHSVYISKRISSPKPGKEVRLVKRVSPVLRIYANLQVKNPNPNL
jgi:hypothetical protein